MYLDLLEKGWTLAEMDRLSIHRIMSLFGDAPQEATESVRETRTFSSKGELRAYLQSQKK